MVFFTFSQAGTGLEHGQALSVMSVSRGDRSSWAYLFEEATMKSLPLSTYSSWFSGLCAVAWSCDHQSNLGVVLWALLLRYRDSSTEHKLFSTDFWNGWRKKAWAKSTLNAALFWSVALWYSFFFDKIISTIYLRLLVGLLDEFPICHYQNL